MKVLLLFANERESQTLRASIEELGHRVRCSADAEFAANLILEWAPDLFVTEDTLGRSHSDAGIRLAELCRANNEISTGSRTQAVVLSHLPDWNCIQKARQTGAHVILKGAHFDATVRYVQVVADNLATDRMLGPILFGVHRFRGASPNLCENCEWVGASVSYATSEVDLVLTAVRTIILNALLFRRRGQSAGEIIQTLETHEFLKRLAKGRLVRETAIKMEITRLRQDIGSVLRKIGAPYGGDHFLPFVHHGFEKYLLAGNWRLSHIPEYRNTVDLLKSANTPKG